MKTITNKLKVALVAVGFLAVGTVSAQRTDTSTNAATDFTKQANTVLGDDGGSVKVIDNKGTIKYLQASNGLTVFTDTAPNGGVVTTWQLGGTITDDTYIDATGQVFAITGIKAIDPTTGNPEDTAATAFDGTGYTIVVRDEASGEIKKMLLSDLLQVTAIGTEYIQSGNATANVNIPVAGLPIIDLAKSHKLFVYRNGVKLRWGTTNTKDFNGDTIEQITINYDATDLPMYDRDVIEVQYIN